MLLCVHVTSVLFLVLAGNSTLLLELHALTLVARSYALLYNINIVEMHLCGHTLLGSTHYFRLSHYCLC